MKTFFYSDSLENCNKCYWQTCPRRYLNKLQVSEEMNDIRWFTSEVPSQELSLDGMPRHGDIVILYAGNEVELERIIANRDNFDGLKKILVVGNPEGIDGGRYHRLGPRFITLAKRSVEEIDAVVHKMKNGLQ